MKYLAGIFMCYLLLSPAMAESARNPFDLAAKSQAVTEYSQRKIYAITEEELIKFSEVGDQLLKQPYEVFMKFADLHFADDGQFRGKTELTIEGSPPQITEIVMTKADYMKFSQEQYSMFQGAKSKTNIDEIKISPDQKSAFVRDTSTLYNTLSPQGGKSAKLAIKMVGRCSQTVIISPEYMLQVKDGDCTIKINIRPI